MARARSDLCPFPFRRVDALALCAVLLAACSSAQEAPEPSTPRPPRARVTPPAPGAPLLLRFRSFDEGESRPVLIALQVEQRARWGEGDAAEDGVSTAVKYAFETTRTVRELHGGLPRKTHYAVRKLEGQTGPDQSWRGSEVELHFDRPKLRVSVDGLAATDAQRESLTGLVALDSVLRMAHTLLPATDRVRVGQAWQPGSDGLRELLQQLGAPDSVLVQSVGASLEEILPCDDGYCAHVATHFSAGPSSSLLLEAQLHLWLRVDSVEPPRKLAWAISLTETTQKGKLTGQRTVTQRQDTLILPRGSAPAKPE